MAKKLTRIKPDDIEGYPTPTNNDVGKSAVYKGNNEFEYREIPTDEQLAKLDGIADGAQNNTGQNTGGGVGIYSGKTGATFNFKSIKAGTGITVTSTATEITITNIGSGTGGSTPTVAFNQLTDTPVSYASNARKVVRVNLAQNGLEFGPVLGTAAEKNTDFFASASHTHTLGNLTQSGATNNQVPVWNGLAWVPTTLNSGGGVGGEVTSVNGQDGDVVITPAGIGASAVGHTHVIGDITNLQIALDGKASATHTHVAADISDSTADGRALLTAANPAAQRTALGLGTAALSASGDFAAASHTQAISTVTGLQTALDGKAASSHTHAIADITNLQTSLDAKAGTTHSHIIADVTGLQTALDGKSGTSHTHSNASTSVAGFMSAADKTKLDGVATGATAVSEGSDSDLRTGTATSYVSARRVFTAAAPVTLTDGTTITPDLNAAINMTVTLGGNRTLANPSNMKAGQSGLLRVVQDGTGSRTLSYGNKWKFPGGAPTLTTTANAVDVIAYYVFDTNTILCSIVKDVK